MLRQKTQYYFFIIAAVISILAGAFTMQQSMESIKFVMLLLSGIIVALLVVKNQKKILISGLSFLVGSYMLWTFLGKVLFLNGIMNMLINFAIFVSTVVLIVGIEQFVKYITLEDSIDKKSLKEDIKEIEELTKKEFEGENFDLLWAHTILFAVGFTFIILLSELFFTISPQLKNIFLILDTIITILFVIDLIVLYHKAKNFEEFLRKNIFDIISAIPLMGVLRALKLIRAVKILKTLRLIKIIKMNKTAKFFSEKSSFNKVNSAPSLKVIKTKTVSKKIKKITEEKTSKKSSKKQIKKTNQKKKKNTTKNKSK